jgi:hypothetical protein
MALAAWTRAAGGGVMLVARWHPRVTTESTGSSGAWWTWLGRLLLLSSGSHGRGPGMGPEKSIAR